MRHRRHPCRHFLFLHPWRYIYFVSVPKSSYIFALANLLCFGTFATLFYSTATEALGKDGYDH